jgi:hypothetical protein
MMIVFTGSARYITASCQRSLAIDEPGYN